MIVSPPSNSFIRSSTYTLAADGDELHSRAEAERVIDLCSNAREVCLDFHGVATIGADFAHHIFHVWPKARPETKVISIHASPSVARMIRRVHAAPDGLAN